MQDQPEVIRVAAAQIDVELLDIEKNVKKHEQLIAQARKSKVDALLFPELSLTGYGVGARGHELAMRHDSPLLERLAQVAPEMCVIVGFLEDAYAAQIFNSAAVLRGGQLSFLHRKLNLATYGNLEEGKFFAAGRYLNGFDLEPPFRGAILVCADLWNPALVHLAALHGATLLFAPINSALDSVSSDFSNPDGWEVVLHFYAMIYGMPIVMANRIGTEKGLTFWGGSRILDPHGNALATAGRDEEQLLIAELDYGALRKARFQLPTVRDSNLGLIQREINRLSTIIGIPAGARSE